MSRRTGRAPHRDVEVAGAGLDHRVEKPVDVIADDRHGWSLPAWRGVLEREPGYHRLACRFTAPGRWVVVSVAGGIPALWGAREPQARARRADLGVLVVLDPEDRARPRGGSPRWSSRPRGPCGPRPRAGSEGRRRGAPDSRISDVPGALVGQLADVRVHLEHLEDARPAAVALEAALLAARRPGRWYGPTISSGAHARSPLSSEAAGSCGWRHVWTERAHEALGEHRHHRPWRRGTASRPCRSGA